MMWYIKPCQVGISDVARLLLLSATAIITSYKYDHQSADHQSADQSADHQSADNQSAIH